ncbi:hypothetical protein [Persephonella sp.]
MKKINWKTEKRKVSELKPADYNPRKLNNEQYQNLRKSIEKFDQVDPVIINTNGTIIGGHQRIQIYLDLGIDEIDVRIPDRKLTKKEEKELNIRLNKNLGDWDLDILSKEFDREELKDWGFNDIELNFIEEENEIKVDEDELTDSMESYLEGSIKQIVLYFTPQEYEDIIPRMKKIMEEDGIDNHTELFLKILENYERNRT